MTTAQELYTNILPHAIAAYSAKTPDMESAKQMAHALTADVVNECNRMGLLNGSQSQPVSPSQGMGAVAPQLVAAVASPTSQPVGTQGPVLFAQAEQQGNSPGGIMPVGAPNQPPQYYGVAGATNPKPIQPAAIPAAPAAPWFPPHLAHLHRPQPQTAAPVARPVGVPQAIVASGEGAVAMQRMPYDVGGTQFIPSSGETFVPPAQAGVMNNVVQVPTPQGHSALGTDGVIVQPSQRPNTQDVIVAPSNQAVITQAGGSGTMFVPERIVR